MDWSFGNIAPDSHPPEAAIAPGVVIGKRYQVTASLGSGSQGEVLRADDLQLGRPVAIKLLKSHHEGSRERFLREGRLTAALTHPNVVNLLAGGLTPRGNPFWVLELLDTPVPLDEFVNGKPLSERMRLFNDVCRGVGAAHAAGIVHRDLKPSNLLVDRRGHVRVCDFGLSVRADEDSRLTQSYAVVGTPLYMPPEALLDGTRNRGPAQDVWALGVLLYELLTGELPFESDNLTELYARIASGAKPPSSLIAVPPDLERVCLRCLRRDPRERYPDASALAAAVQAASLARPRARGVIPMAVLAACALSGAVWVMTLTLGSQPAPETTEPETPEPETPEPAPPYVFPEADAEYIAQLERAIQAHDEPGLRVLINAGIARGHPDAFQAQGVVHNEGWGVPVNPQAAVECFQRAARGGSVRGLTSLGFALEHGNGIERNLSEALRIYERAARRGSSGAHARLGYHYMKGVGVKQDLARAEEHLLVCADEQPAAAYQLAVLYYGQRQNAKGAPWLLKAAIAGHPPAMYEQGVLCLDRGQGEQALSWLRRSGEAGSAKAECRLAAIYLDGELVAKNEQTALEWVRRAAKHSALGTYNLGVFYNRGYGVEEDPVKARALFLQAAEGGEPAAMWSASRFLLEGRGGPANPIASHRWLRKSAELGYGHAQNMLGKRIMLGVTPNGANLGPTERLERALPWLQRGAKSLKTPGSWYDLGACLGRLQRLAEAQRWLQRAAEGGHVAAYASLGDLLCHEGETHDPEEALRWFRRGAEHDQLYPLVAVGRMLEGKSGVAADLVGAREAYERAIDLGSRAGMFRLAGLLKDDSGGPPDVARGRALLERALKEAEAEEGSDPGFLKAVRARLAEYPLE